MSAGPRITWHGPRFVAPDGRRHDSLVTTADGRIAALGSHDGARRRLPEGFVLPGFVDTHAHLARLGQRPDALHLEPDDTVDEIAAAVAARARELAAQPGEWILGRGWLDPCARASGDAPALPDHRALTRAAPAHPVAFKRADEHAMWCNALALQRAGITADTPDPDGGHIVRDAAGRPTGVLVDAAMRLVKDAIGTPPAHLVEQVVAEEADAFLASGVTCVHEMAVEAYLFDVLDSMAAQARLPLRVRAFLYAGDPANHARMARPIGPPGPDHFAVRGIKLFADGALGSRGARLSCPWPGDGSCGVQLDPTPLQRKAARHAAAGGYQLAVHAIGDAAVRDAVDLILEHQPDTRARWRIEHAQIMSGADVQRAAAGGICAAVQPIHAAHDLPWAARLLGQCGLLHRAYRWRSLAAAGIPIGLGTDHPIESLDVRGSLLSATVDRGTLPGRHERLTRAAALQACWRGGAYLTFDEPWLGALVPGYLADFAVWDTDLTACPPDALRRARCLATVVAGQLVWTRADV